MDCFPGFPCSYQPSRRVGSTWKARYMVFYFIYILFRGSVHVGWESLGVVVWKITFWNSEPSLFSVRVLKIPPIGFSTIQHWPTSDLFTLSKSGCIWLEALIKSYRVWREFIGTGIILTVPCTYICLNLSPAFTLIAVNFAVVKWVLD